MKELDILEGIETTYGYLARRGDASFLVDNAAAFTRHAAWALRGDGWALVRKPEGLNRQGLDVDKILHRHTMQMVDIVIAAGSDAQRIGWQIVAVGNASQIVDPLPPPGVELPPVPPVPPVPPTSDAVVEALKAIGQDVSAMRAHSSNIEQILTRAAAKFGI